MTDQPMIQVHDLGETYDEILAKFRESLDDAKRHWLAYMLVNYPYRDALEQSAEWARVKLEAERVEVNAIYERAQVTVASAPTGMRQTIRAKESLCVLTASTGWALAVDDIGTDPVLDGHPARGAWGAWASVPLVIQDRCVGSICALENHAREWTQHDQEVLMGAAMLLSAQVEGWIESERRP